MSTAEIASLQAKVTAAKNIQTLAKLERQIADARRGLALPVETAQHFLEQIRQHEIRLKGLQHLEVAHTLSDLADCYGKEQAGQAVELRRQALSIACKTAPGSAFAMLLRRDLARELVLGHANREQVRAVCPPCPQCHANGHVVPVFGLLPFPQKQYGYGFVTGGCSPEGPFWYCRKCKGSFSPYSKDAYIMDESAQAPH